MERDPIQDRIADYVVNMRFDQLPGAVVHAATTRVVYCTAALIAGMDGDACRIARQMAERFPMKDGATVLGTRIRSSPEIAAFANGTTARFIEMNDIYHWPNVYEGHASDIVPAMMTAAEYAHADGRSLIASIALAYEVFLRLCDVAKNRNFDNTNFGSIAVAAGASMLLGLSREATGHAISMAATTGNMLRQVRKSHLSMWKGAAAGNSGRTGIHCALLAKEGMDGPHLPFVGESGWCDHVAGNRFTLDRMGSDDEPYRILNTRLKRRASCGTTISSIIAAEKVAKVGADGVAEVIVDVYHLGKVDVGTGEHRWNPQSRETADHSIPYVVGVTLLEGTVVPTSFDEAHLADEGLRAFMRKIRVEEDPAFTAAYDLTPVQHRTRVTVVMNDGTRRIGETGGDADDLSAETTDDEVNRIFRDLTKDAWPATQVRRVLDRLWAVGAVTDVAKIPPMLVR